MTGLTPAILAAVAAGAMIPVGAIIARVDHFGPEWLDAELRHGVVAFGGGILLAAVAFLLVPAGAEHLSNAWAVGAFLLGGLLIYGIDRRIGSQNPRTGHLLAIISDYIPEAVAMGALFATGDERAMLLALMIGAQNLAEGFGVYRGRESLQVRDGLSLWALLGLIILVGVLAVVTGHVLLAEQPLALGILLLLAAGSLFYVIFQDIAYDAHMERARAPALGAVAGFALGMLGHFLLG